MEYEAIANELRSYRVWVKEYKSLKEERDLLMHKLCGLKSPDTTKEPSKSHNDKLIEQYRLEIIDDIGDIDNELKRLWSNIEHTEKILAKISPNIAKSLINIFVLGVSFEKEARDRGLKWGSALKREIESEIKLI